MLSYSEYSQHINGISVQIYKNVRRSNKVRFVVFFNCELIFLIPFLLRLIFALKQITAHQKNYNCRFFNALNIPVDILLHPTKDQQEDVFLQDIAANNVSKPERLVFAE